MSPFREARHHQDEIGVLAHEPTRPAAVTATRKTCGTLPRSDNRYVATSVTGTTAVFCLLALVVEDLQTWALIPVAVCAMILIPDAIRVLVGAMAPLDVRAVLAFGGIISFVVVPVLHLAWNVWPVRYKASEPVDFEVATFYVASATAAGLLVMKLVANLVSRGSNCPERSGGSVSRAYDIQPLKWLIGSSLTIHFVNLAIVGGPFGYVDVADGSLDLAGMGPLLVIGEAAPVLIVAFLLLRYRRALLQTRTSALLAYGLVFAIFVFVFFGGLRGSRGTFLFTVLACAGMFSIWIRPINRYLVAVLAVVGFSFMLIYGQYKSLGVDAFAKWQEQGAAAVFEETQRGPAQTVLGDLGRTAVQAVIFHKWLNGEYQIAWGGTYIGDSAFLFAPRALFPDRVEGKTYWGTLALQGLSDVNGGKRSSRVYGLAGQAMLNFGLWGVPFAFAILGALLGWLTKADRRLQVNDPARLLLPLNAVALLVFLTSDLDNAIWIWLKIASLPTLGILFFRRRVSDSGRGNLDSASRTRTRVNSRLRRN